MLVPAQVSCLPLDFNKLTRTCTVPGIQDTRCTKGSFQSPPRSVCDANVTGRRYSIWFIFGSVVGSFGGILAYGLIQMDGLHGIEGWRWVSHVAPKGRAIQLLQLVFARQD